MRLVILGTGGMAAQHAKNFSAIDGVSVVGGIDVDPGRLAAFNAAHNIPNGFASLDAALAWGEFDAVANVTPDSIHHATSIAALKAGKHVFCEKPLATDATKAFEMVDVAEASGLINMVNLSYRNVPALQKAAQMVRDGAIGTIRHFEASYLQSWLTQPAWGHWDREPQWLWRLSTKHGSKGVLGDVGIHILDFATFIAGMDATQVSCLLQTFDKAPGGQIGDYVLDANDSATMQVRLTNGALGTVAATRFATGHLNDLRLRLYGQTGGLEVTFEKTVSHLRACLGEDIATGTWTDVDCPPVPTIYQRFVAAIRGESAADPDFARGAALQRLLDRAVDSADQDGKLLAV